MQGIIAGLIMLAGIYAAALGFSMMQNLKETVDRMQNSLKQSYPEQELPPQLQKNPSETTPPKGFLPCRKASKTADEADSFFLDVEEEKQYLYYVRTHNVVSDTSIYRTQQQKDGSWYGYDEWMQDMTADRVGEEILKGNREAGEKQ